MREVLDVKYVTFEGASGLERFKNLQELIDWIIERRKINAPVLIVWIQLA